MSEEDQEYEDQDVEHELIVHHHITVENHRNGFCYAKIDGLMRRVRASYTQQNLWFTSRQRYMEDYDKFRSKA